MGFLNKNNDVVNIDTDGKMASLLLLLLLTRTLRTMTWLLTTTDDVAVTAHRGNKKTAATDNRILISRHHTQAVCTGKNVTNFTERKYGRHFERRAPTGQRNTPHHSCIAVHAQK